MHDGVEDRDLRVLSQDVLLDLATEDADSREGSLMQSRSRLGT